MLEWLIAVGVILAPVSVGSLLGLCALKARSATFMVIDPRHIEAHNQASAVVPDLLPQKKKKSGVLTFPLGLMVAVGTIVCLIYIVGITFQVPSQPGSGLMMLIIGGSYLILQITGSLLAPILPNELIPFKVTLPNLLSGLLFMLLAGYFYGLHDVVTQAHLDDGPLKTVSAVFDDPLTGLVLVLVAVIGTILVVLFGTLFYLLHALQNCHYDRALRRAKLLSGILPSFSLNMGAIVMIYAGRYDEAEALISECLQSIKSANTPPIYASELSVLGHVRLRQGRYAEAEDVLSTALEIDPNNYDANVYLAETYLEQGHEAARALELLDEAIAKKSKRPGNYDRHMWGDIYGNKAWALAQLGMFEASTAAIDEGFARMDQKFLPGMAGIHWRVGHALLLNGDYDRAHDHFRTAVHIDPNGAYGRLAADKLKRL